MLAEKLLETDKIQESNASPSREIPEYESEGEADKKIIELEIKSPTLIKPQNEPIAEENTQELIEIENLDSDH